jgi:glycosyltransferase involved in cell wall biosynthesis
MKIVFLSPHSDPEARLGEPDAGGQCLYEHQLAKALSTLPGIEVTTYCRLASKRPQTSQVTDQYRIRRITCERNQYIPKEKIERTIHHFSKKIAQELKGTTQPLIFHGHYWDGGKTSLFLKSQFPQAGLVWTPHSLGAVKRRNFEGEWNEQIYNFIPRLVWENYTAFAADAIVVSSLVEKLQVSRQYLANPKKINVIAPGIDPELFTPMDQEEARKKLNLSQNTQLLLCLGRIDRTKGYHHAIRVLHELLIINSQSNSNPAIKKDIKLMICGGSSRPTAEENDYIQELKQLAEKLGVGKKVIFHKAVPHHQTRFYYAASDIFLLTSENEPFGLTVLEAMSMGKPVISFNEGGPSNIISHNQTGFLVEKHDYERMAYYVQTLLDHPHVHSRIGHHARAFVVADFNWLEKAEEFTTIYRQALNHQLKPALFFTQWLNNNYFLKHNLNL